MIQTQVWGCNFWQYFCSISAKTWVLLLDVRPFSASKKNKNQDSILRAFSWCINIFYIFGVETYFTVCLRLKKEVLNSLSNITEDLNKKPVLLLSSEGALKLSLYIGGKHLWLSVVLMEREFLIVLNPAKVFFCFWDFLKIQEPSRF